MPDYKNAIGETAGRVWQALSSDGPQTVAQLKKKLRTTQELLHLSLGWLAREDKVEITEGKAGLRVQLK
jgi:hypothetical protein